MDLLQKVPCRHRYIQCPQPCSRPPPTHTSTGDSRTPTGKSGTVSVGSLLLSPGSWCTRFCCAHQESIFQFCVSYSISMVGLIVISSKRAYAIPKSAAPRAPVPAADHHQPIPPQEMLKHSSVSISVGPWVWCAQALFEPSEHLWQEQGLILNVNSPLLQSC